MVDSNESMNFASNINTNINSAKFTNGRPIQIISFEMRKTLPSKMNLDKVVLREILKSIGDREAALLTIAGPSRKGKSLMMSYLVKFLQKQHSQNIIGNWIGDLNSEFPLKGFPFRNGDERQTVGIYLWSEPFILVRSDGSEVAVFLMDTQGVFDEETSEREWSAIIGLSLLTSSCMMYNIFTDLMDDVLRMLYIFMQYGLYNMKTDEKCFQRLFFLIRDWNNPQQYPYGATGGKQFINKKMEPKASMPKELVEVRQIFSTCFEEVDCFLFPPPGEKAKRLDFEGANVDLEPDFVKFVKDFVEDLLTPDHIQSKKMGGSKMRGQSLFKYFEQYVTAFNKNSTNPNLSFIDGMCHGSCGAAEEEAGNLYKIWMEEKIIGKGLFSQQHLEQFHQESLSKANNHFDQQNPIGDPAKHFRKYKTLLESNANTVFKELVTQHNSQQEVLAKNWIEMSLESFLKSVEGQMAPTGGDFIVQNTLDIILETARKSAFDTFKTHTGDQYQSFFSVYLPQLNNHLKLMQDKLQNENMAKMNSAKENCEAAVEYGVQKYKSSMSLAISIEGSYIDEDRMKKLHEISSRASIKKYRKSAKTGNEELLERCQINILEGRIIAEFENYVQQNAKLKLAGDERKIKFIQTQVYFHHELISKKITTEEIWCESQLENECGSAIESVKKKLKSENQNLLVQEMDEIEAILNQELYKRYEELKIFLHQKIVELEQTIEQEFARVREVYTETFHKKIDSTAEVFSGETLDQVHKEVCSHVIRCLQMKNHFSDVEKEKHKEDLARLLQKQFVYDIVNKNERKKLEAEKQAGIWSDEMCKEYQQGYNNFTNLLMTEGELKTIHENHSETVKQKFLAKITPYGAFLQTQLLETLSSKIEDNRIIIFKRFQHEQGEQDEIANQIFETSLAFYQAEIERQLGDDLIHCHTINQIMTSYSYAKSKTLAEFDFDCRNRRVQSSMISSLRTKLIEKMEVEIEERKNSYSIRQGQMEEETQRKFDFCIETYKSQLQIFLKGSRSTEELRSTHEKHKESIISEFLQTILTNPQREDWKNRLRQEVENVLEITINPEFANILQQRQDSIECLLEQSTETYRKAMTDLLDDNIVHDTHTIEKAHRGSTTKSIDKFHQSGAAVINELSPNDIQRLEADLLRKLEEEYLRFLAKEKEAFKDLESTADIMLANHVSEYIREMEDAYSKAVTINSLVEAHNRIVFEMKPRFLQSCNFPISSLVDKYETRFMDRLQERLTMFQIEFQSTEIRPEVLKLEMIGVIARYKKEMDELILERKNSYIDLIDLVQHHNQCKTDAVSRFKVKNIRVTQHVKESLDATLKQIFNKYKDENSLKATTTEPAIGIDLGTTYSCVAVYKGQGTDVEVIPNEFHAKTTPSFIRYNDEGEVKMVGKPAKDQAFMEPTKTIFDVKRLIGRRFTDKEVQADIKLWPFIVVPGGENRNIPIIQIGSKMLPPEKCSSEVLKNLKASAEKYLGKSVKRAVITVPAYFNDGQRQATRDAGKLAGLEVMAIINEPTAAAIAYSLQCTDEQERNVLIYDFGGGTFDVAILKIAGGKIENKALGGDTHLGGEDIDSILMNYCVSEFKTTNGVDLSKNNDTDTNTDKEARGRKLRRLRHTCEEMKINLSGQCDNVTVNIDAIHGEMDLKVVITREKFEEINAELFDKTIDILRKSILDAGIRVDDIDDVVLVGGSTKIPKIQELLQNLFPGKGLKRSVHPDEAVAFGAAIQAAILNGSWDQRNRFISLIDITPLSLGTDVVGDIFSEIIPKNTSLPAKMTRGYQTSYANQTEVSVCIYEGENKIASANHLLGKFVLRGIPRGPKGKEKVDVTMEINTDGILNVKAVSLSTGREASINIEESKGRLTASDLEDLM